MSNLHVGIIGAGVSGLVSAVNMYKVGIRPIVFDKASGIGGMWNADLKPCWNSMRTNISKFSTALADFSWPKEAPIFPNQRDVYQHLLNYVQQSLPKDVFRLNTKVINVSYSNAKWTIEYQTKSNDITIEQFDFVIIASGFFDSPHMPADIPGLSSLQGTLLHSCDYRSSEQVSHRRVIIAGASMSAAEIASDIAASAEHVIHIVPRRFWSVPRFGPLIPTDPASPFLPIDLIFYRQSTRPSKHENVLSNADANKRANELFRLITGNNQKSSKMNDASDDKPAVVAISDMYAEWSRAGKVTLEQGRLVQVEQDGTLVLNNGTTIKTTTNDILILCTGYRPCLDFFSEDILEQLSYQPDELFSPVILHRTIFHPSLPNLAFIGMYRGPFWGIIELQSRWVASIFAGLSPIPSIATQQSGLDIERRVRAAQPRPQFPHADFVGMANDLAEEVFGTTFSSTSDIVISTQFRSDGPDQTVLDEMNSLCAEANNGRFIAGAVFRALHQSKWTFERTLIGKPTDGIVRGQAEFHSSNEKELLYNEQGKLILSSSIPLDVTQKYLYVYEKSDDLLTVYFVDHQNERGAIFHTIHFQPKQTSSSGWIAHGEHLCQADHYSVSYLFAFHGMTLSRFEITYTVKGPAKDYVSKTIFQSQ